MNTNQVNILNNFRIGNIHISIAIKETPYGLETNVAVDPASAVEPVMRVAFEDQIAVKHISVVVKAI